MKKIFLVLFSLLMFGQVSAQEQQTLMGSLKNKRVGGFGGPMLHIASLNGRTTVASGGGGGVILNNFFVGGYGQGEFYENFNTINTTTYDLEIGTGGLWLGWTPVGEKLLHPYLSVKVGGGAINYEVNNDNSVNDRTDAIWSLHPEVGAEMNINNWFRAGIVVGYRYMGGVNLNVPNVSAADFNRPTVGLHFRFGYFGY